MSGGGDDFLIVWDWIRGTEKQRLDLRAPVDKLRASKGLTRTSQEPLVVSGIWNLPSSSVNRLRADLVVTCEAYVYTIQEDRLANSFSHRVPGLFLYRYSGLAEMEYCGIVPTDHNVVDVTIVEAQSKVFYSMDPFCEPFAMTKTIKDENALSQVYIGCECLLDNAESASTYSNVGAVCDGVNLWAEDQTEVEPKGAGLSLYNLESLRKRGQED